ncbi:MAG: gliding motility-associated C-terminal domain-containing protein [Bacteroidetes bacterium]|nr:gliding motility-associated C-terminal domain-containing protein [Bacteroidota bacterium]
MKKQLTSRNILIEGIIKSTFIFFFLFSVGSLFGQEIIINKTAVENDIICNQFDITLEITGNPPPKPQEVVLVIDRSGSMDNGSSPTPMDYAIDAAKEFVNNLFVPANNPTGLNKVAIVSYADEATLEIGLTDSSGLSNIIDIINDIEAGGYTNIDDGLYTADQELINNGTYDCATSRNIILLTDGLANRDRAGDDCDTNPQTSTLCIEAAIASGVNAQTTVVNGELFTQKVFSIGLTGAIAPPFETLAIDTLDKIQNAGLFITEEAADLSAIYTQILGQLVAAATIIAGEPMVTDVITTDFELVPGTLVTSKGIALVSGQLISWFVDEIFDETITLNYSIIAISANVCGNQNSGTTVISYQDSNCNIVSLVFQNPGICVPCPEIDPFISRQNCTNFIDYSGTLNEGDCSPVTSDFSWEFFLNNVLVGTSNVLNGTFEYTGIDPFVGDFKAELTYIGTYGSGCTLPDVVSETTIVLFCPDPAIAIVKTSSYDDGGDCSDPGELIDYTFTVTNQGNVSLSNILVTDPLLEAPNPVVAIVFVSGDTDSDNELDVTETWIYTASYAITQDDIDAGQVTNQATVEGTAPDLSVVTDDSGTATDNDDPTVTDLCQDPPAIAIVKTSSYDDGGDCSDPGELIDYTFTVTNQGNVSLSNIVVTDPLLGGVIAGPDSGDTDSDNELDVTETWIYTASYAITQDDIDAGQVTNQATAEGTAPDLSVVTDDSGTATDNDDPTITIFCQVASMSVEKTGVFNDENGDGSAQVGETISYNFKVTNTGSVTLYNITIDDPLPGIMIEGGPIEVLLPGEFDDSTFTATYVITQNDIDNLEVVNQAIGSGVDGDGNEITDLSDDPNDPTNIDDNDDGEPDDPTVVILPQVDEPFEIFNGITPDGDGLNDFFFIQGIEEYPNNNVKIYNRWGIKVFEIDGYGGSTGTQFVFSGISDGRTTIRKNEELPTGTYYYVLTIFGENPGKSSYAGYLYINR